MAFADRLIDRMLAQSDPNAALEARAVNSMILLNDANAAASVGKVLSDLTEGDKEINPVIKSALERIASKIAV